VPGGVGEGFDRDPVRRPFDRGRKRRELAGFDLYPDRVEVNDEPATSALARQFLAHS
jgi:hypothetical protein